MHKIKAELRLILFTCLAIALSCFSHAQESTLPAGYLLLSETEGDLDRDSIPEKVRVYETGDSLDDGSVREIQLLKKQDNAWILWKKSRNAIKASNQGGMRGDPFSFVEIKNGILLIHHEGGSSWIWTTVDKYRFQHNEFELIGFNKVFGKFCEYWSECDFNLSTGQVIYTSDPDRCEDSNSTNYAYEKDVFIKKGIHLNLMNRHLNEVMLKTPKKGHDIYL